MPNTHRRRSSTRGRRRGTRKKKQHRGPIMRFRFGQLVLLWIFSFIICFGSYLYARNFHPEKDVFIKKPDTELSESDGTSDITLEPENDDTAAPDEDSQPDTNPGDGITDVPVEENPEDEPYTPSILNPVPESMPESPEYLARCAFLGETNIYNLGQEGMLQPFSVYASDKLTLKNYTREYVMLQDTTIRILSAMNSANCPTYVMFGTETLAENPPDQSADQFTNLLTSLIATAPEAKIHVLSIPPVTEDAEKADPPLLNSDIDSYNSKLLDLCNSLDVYFVDVNTALKNNEGKLDRTLALEDGIHLTPEGGQILLNYVLNHIPVE